MTTPKSKTKKLSPLGARLFPPSRSLPGCGIRQMPCITAEPPANLSARLLKVYTMLVAMQEVCAVRHLQRISEAAGEIRQIIKEIK